MQQNLVTFADKLRRATSNDERQTVLLAELQKFGFEQFVYAFSAKSPNRPEEYVNINNLDTNWMDHYIAAGLFQEDWLLDYALSNTKPVSWTEMYSLEEQGKILPKYQKTMFRARDFSVTNGYTIPIATSARIFAGVSIVAKNDLPETEIQKEWETNKNYIHTCMDLFHCFVDRGTVATKQYRISPRQHEVLSWLADGLQQQQIADRLGIHVSRVEAHVRAARKRLDAATPAQAVATALKLGII